MKLLNDPISAFVILFVVGTVALISTLVFILVRVFPPPEINLCSMSGYVRDHEERIKALEAK